MTSEQRRSEIIQVAVPLIIEHGANVTTRQIAQAAGIAEGTVFRVFADKEELLSACIAEVFRTDVVIDEVRQVSSEQDIEDQLLEVSMLIMAHFERFGELMRALVSSGYLFDRKHDDRRDRHKEFIQEISNAFADVLRREEKRWRIPVDELAQILMGVSSSLRFDPQGWENREAKLAQGINIVLHGAIKR